MSFRMEFDWVDAPRSTDAQVQATMAALTIEVHGCSVTSVLDHQLPTSHSATWTSGVTT